MSKTVLLTSEWHCPMPGGGHRRFRHLDDLDGVPEEKVEWLVSIGAAGPPPTPSREPSGPAKGPGGPVEAPEAPRRAKAPRNSASAAEWREYAASRGVKTKGLTRAQLIAAVRDLDNN